MAWFARLRVLGGGWGRGFVVAARGVLLASALGVWELGEVRMDGPCAHVIGFDVSFGSWWGSHVRTAIFCAPTNT
jgi:hypothetical protein